MSAVESTIYEAMGGADALLALAEAWHRRCLADPILAHAFKDGIHPEHTERLAAYWSEQLGGPAGYTGSLGDYSHVVGLHSGNGPHEQMDGRAVALFVASLDGAEVCLRDRPSGRHASAHLGSPRPMGWRESGGFGPLVGDAEQMRARGPCDVRLDQQSDDDHRLADRLGGFISVRYFRRSTARFPVVFGDPKGTRALLTSGVVVRALAG